MDAGDREIFLAEVVDAATAAKLDPLTIDALCADAPPDKLSRMDELFARDAELDTRRIDAFRSRPR